MVCALMIFHERCCCQWMGGSNGMGGVVWLQSLQPTKLELRESWVNIPKKSLPSPVIMYTTLFCIGLQDIHSG